MATTVAALIAAARRTLHENSEIMAPDGFWTDAELAAHANTAAHDLWRAICDLLNQDYFFTVDASLVSQEANAETLTGVPADVAIVRGLEPRVLTNYPALRYEQAPYNSTKFQRARAWGTVSPDNAGPIYWAVSGAGAPVGAPTIRVAPALSATVPLRLCYAPTLLTLVHGVAGAGEIATNPIPGESDNAIIAWIIAYAIAKDSEDRLPDAGWLSIYGTEKQNILTALTPRADEDDTIVEALFEDEWG